MRTAVLPICLMPVSTWPLGSGRAVGKQGGLRWHCLAKRVKAVAGPTQSSRLKLGAAAADLPVPASDRSQVTTGPPQHRCVSQPISRFPLPAS